ncbi:MAG: hypothetical protein PHW31_04545 [Candidatus Pacebacteria bacterium]|nr:hypothetical protein [Candidatus Paceibacterota bacterium]
MERVLGLYFHGDRVVFCAEFSSPEPADVSYCNVCAVGVREYREGIALLAQKKHCEMHDLLASGELIIDCDVSGGAVKFTTPAPANRTSDLYPKAFQSQWTVAQLCLPGMEVECSARQTVPNVFQGPRWG